MPKGIELFLYENIAAWFDQPDIAVDEAIKYDIRAQLQKSEYPIDVVLNMDGRRMLILITAEQMSFL